VLAVENVKKLASEFCEVNGITEFDTPFDFDVICPDCEFASQLMNTPEKCEALSKLRAENSELADSLIDLTTIYGVDFDFAHVLFRLGGFKSASEFRQIAGKPFFPITINDKTRVGVKYFDDMRQKIPLEVVNRITNLIREKTRDRCLPAGKCELSAEFNLSGLAEIDMIWIGDTFPKFEDVFPEIVFHFEEFDTQFLYRCLAKFPEADYASAVKINFHLAPTPASTYSIALHLRGPSSFLIELHRIALEKRMKLTFRALIGRVNEIPVDVSSEQMIFEQLDVDYVPINERRNPALIEQLRVLKPPLDTPVEPQT
jgi:hypothetical protein